MQRLTLSLGLLLLSMGMAQAQNLDMETADPTAAVERPVRGLSMTQVEARYGAPSQRHSAVGNPPITRWDYGGFSVFFEYDRVIHAVAPRQPPRD